MAVIFNADLIPFYVGDTYAVDHTISNLPAGQTVATCTLGFKRLEDDPAPFFSLAITPSPSGAGQITNTGSPQFNGTVTAEGVFTLSGGAGGNTGPATFSPATTYWYYLHCVTFAGAEYTSEHATVTTNVGGPLG